MAKQIAIVIAERGKIEDRTLEAGTTAADIIKDVGLPDSYVLTKGKGGQTFGADEEIYSQVSDGQKLTAVAPVDVGS